MSMAQTASCRRTALLHRRIKRLAGTLGLTLAALAGSVWGLRGQTETLLLSVGDAQRTALVHVPTDLDDGSRWPLVVAFHGSALNGRIMEEMTRFSALADEERFIVAYPNGSGPANALSWNAGYCCSFALERNADDLGFVRALLDELIATYPVDPQRVYATGFSNGGMLVYALAVEMPDRFAAIASVAGAMYPSQEGPTAPVPVLAIHGTDDQIVPYDGGVGLLAGISGKTEPSLSCSETIALWVEASGCPAEPTVSRERDARIETYDACEGRGEVTLITLVDGGHEWPSIRRDDSALLLAETVSILGLLEQDQTETGIPWDVFESGIDATRTIWAFFNRH